MRLFGIPLMVALSLQAGGCVTARVGGTSSPGHVGRDGISRFDLDRLSGLTAFEAVQRLRSHWLEPRGIGAAPVLPVVFVDGERRGDTMQLSMIAAADVQSIRFIEASADQFGRETRPDVIAVTMR